VAIGRQPRLGLALQAHCGAQVTPRAAAKTGSWP